MAPIAVRVCTTDQLTAVTLEELRRLFFAAFDERFDEADWRHALGGRHVIAREIGSNDVVAHAAVVDRGLLVGGRAFRTGYVEAVATLPARQRQGLGRLVMTEVAAVLKDAFELGALATGVSGFYSGLGWEIWRGPVLAYGEDGEYPVPQEEGAVMVLRFGASVTVDLASSISAPTREGDDW